MIVLITTINECQCSTTNYRDLVYYIRLTVFDLPALLDINDDDYNAALRYLDKRLSIKLNANREVSGVLRGFDQFMNLVRMLKKMITTDSSL